MIGMTRRLVAIFGQRITDIVRLTRSPSVQQQSQWLPRPDAKGWPWQCLTWNNTAMRSHPKPRFLHIFVIRMPATGRYVNRCHRRPHDVYFGRSTPPSPHVVPGRPRLPSPYITRCLQPLVFVMFTSFKPTNTLRHQNPIAFLHQALNN